MLPAEIYQASLLLSNLLSGLVGALAGAIVGGVLSFWGSWYSTKRILAYEAERSKHARDIDLVLKFDDRFNSDSFKKTRAAVAKSVLNFRDKLTTERKNRKTGITNDPHLLLLDVYNASNVKEDVFDFFESVGLLFRRYDLDEELMWSNFYPWVDGYWQTTKEYIFRRTKAGQYCLGRFQISL
jgi:hypothetical protein